MDILAESLQGRFTWIDWAVLAGYLAATTAIGAAMAGRQATIRDFFLGGRKLPWYAVSGSTIATEISAVTFVGVPAIVFAGGLEGNFKYLQLCLLGNVLARVIVGCVFVPAYYRREIYSPYDYMAGALGERVRTLTTVLFIFGGALAQGARVYLTALILDLIVGEPLFGRLAAATGVSTLSWSIYLVGVIAVGWAWIGGITTVIWTDVILFLVFVFGALAALLAIIIRLPGSPLEGVSYMIQAGWAARDAGPWGRFTFFDFDWSPARQYTFWTAVFATTWGGLYAYGTDQMMAQRMFCCRGPREARLAIISSTAGQVVTVMMCFVGVGLYAFYRVFELPDDLAARVAGKPDLIFPIFILRELPAGVTGLVIAGIFAAALSTLVSVVAAYSQTTISAFYLPWRRRRRTGGAGDPLDDPAEQRRLVLLSRVLVVLWGAILCAMAQVAEAASGKFPEILNLALAMAGYTGGALLAGFLLAFLRLNIDDRGFLWSAPLSVLTVFALVWHESWAHAVCWVGAGLILAGWLWMLARERIGGGPDPGRGVRNLLQTVLLVAGLVLMLWLSYRGWFDVREDPIRGTRHYVTVAWPWFVPIGSTVAFVFGYALARPARRPVSSTPTEREGA